MDGNNGQLDETESLSNFHRSASAATSISNVSVKTTDSRKSHLSAMYVKNKFNRLKSVLSRKKSKDKKNKDDIYNCSIEASIKNNDSTSINPNSKSNDSKNFESLNKNPNVNINEIEASNDNLNDKNTISSSTNNNNSMYLSTVNQDTPRSISSLSNHEVSDSSADVSSYTHNNTQHKTILSFLHPRDSSPSTNISRSNSRNDDTATISDSSDDEHYDHKIQRSNIEHSHQLPGIKLVGKHAATYDNAMRGELEESRREHEMAEYSNRTEVGSGTVADTRGRSGAGIAGTFYMPLPKNKDIKRFVRYFPDLNANLESLIVTYRCALSVPDKKDLPGWQGKIFITKSHVCYHGRNLGGLNKVLNLQIPLKDISAIEKKMTVGIVPCAIRIKIRTSENPEVRNYAISNQHSVTNEEYNVNSKNSDTVFTHGNKTYDQFDFINMLSRDNCYEFLTHCWLNVLRQVHENFAAGASVAAEDDEVISPSNEQQNMTIIMDKDSGEQHKSNAEKRELPLSAVITVDHSDSKEDVDSGHHSDGKKPLNLLNDHETLTESENYESNIDDNNDTSNELNSNSASISRKNSLNYLSAPSDITDLLSPSFVDSRNRAKGKIVIRDRHKRSNSNSRGVSNVLQSSNSSGNLDHKRHHPHHHHSRKVSGSTKHDKAHSSNVSIDQKSSLSILSLIKFSILILFGKYKTDNPSEQLHYKMIRILALFAICVSLINIYIFWSVKGIDYSISGEDNSNSDNFAAIKKPMPIWGSLNTIDIKGMYKIDSAIVLQKISEGQLVGKYLTLDLDTDLKLGKDVDYISEQELKDIIIAGSEFGIYNIIYSNSPGSDGNNMSSDVPKRVSILYADLQKSIELADTVNSNNRGLLNFKKIKMAISDDVNAKILSAVKDSENLEKSWESLLEFKYESI